MSTNEKLAASLHLPMPEGMTRVETGPIRFGEDWAGYFLRGDNAMGLAQEASMLEFLADNPEQCTRMRVQLTVLARRLRRIGKEVEE